jgi:hypothetical protein
MSRMRAAQTKARALKTAQSLKEDEELITAGFEYITERDGAKLCRKRK